MMMMASDLVTRLPLLQKHANITNEKDTNYSTKSLPQTTNYLSSTYTENPTATSPHVPPTPTQSAPNVDQFGTTNRGYTYVVSGGFRYQIRRPVESWKFVESRKQDGSVLYLCRLCQSSYKHKKSLNKHWKDKHNDIPCPAGFRSDDEEEDDDVDDGDVNGPEADVSKSESPLDIENMENIPPSTERVRAPHRVELNNEVATNYSVTRRLSNPTKRLTHGTKVMGQRRSLMLPRGHYSSNSWIPIVSGQRKRETPEAHSLQTYYASTEGLRTKRRHTQYADKIVHSHSQQTHQSHQQPEDHPMSHSHQAMNEIKPLDLSSFRTLEHTLVQSQSSPSTSRVEHEKEEKGTNDLNCSVLITLLQTAMNTLKSEAPQNDSHCKGLKLSRASTNLLFSIGTLLVTLVEPLTEEGEKKSLLQPHLSSTPSISSGSSVSGAEMCVSAPTAPTPVLPPPPLQSALYGSALDRSDLMVDSSSFYQSKPTTTTATTNHDACDQQQKPIPGKFLYVSSNAYRSHMLTEQPQTLTSVIEYASDYTHSSTLSSFDQSPSAHNKSLQSRNAPPDDHPSASTIICPVCQYDARWFSELRAHMVNHSDHRMFGCCYCPYRAKWKWDVAKHMRRCPLGRHVAHLNNEALLRIVRYHPPPVDNILHNYFPQYGFPGVGLDSPPTPPKNQSAVNRHLPDLKPRMVMEPVVPSMEDGRCDFSMGPPILSHYEAVTPDMSHSLNLDDGSPDMSPQALVIADEDLDVNPRENSVSIKQEQKDTEHKESFLPTSDTSASSLVCRLKKCSKCNFHSMDESELRTHLQLHTTSTNVSSISSSPKSMNTSRTVDST